MEVVAGLVIAAVLAVTAYYVAGGRQLRTEPQLEPRPGLPDDRAAVGDDVDAVRLPVAARGYRMDVVDAVLDRLADELRARDEEIRRLGGRDVEAGGGTAGAGRDDVDGADYGRGDVQRADPDRAGSDRAGSDRAGSDRSGSDRSGTDRSDIEAR